MKQIITTHKAPQAIGAYSQAVKVANLVFISGQIGLDPETMQLVNGGFDAESNRVFQNLQAVVLAAGGTLDGIVKMTIYLTDLSDFSRLNEIMSEYFVSPYPARAVVQVVRLPKDASIEIEALLMLAE